MFDYAYSAEALRRFNECSVKEHSSVRLWMELADAIGPMLLPFVVKPEAYSAIPFSAMGIKATPLSSLRSRRGEMWILFCFRDGSFGNVDTPLRNDGFALILEWRKGRQDSPLLSSALRGLADNVRRQLAITGWSLHPSFDRYGDRISFTDAELFSDAEHIDNVASAWGALAAGLYCVHVDQYPSQWPFPSLQWDMNRGCVAGVAGLLEKTSVARDCGATSIVVERRQAVELRDFLRGHSAREAGGVLIYGVSQCSDARKVAEQIAFGVERKRRQAKTTILLILATSCLIAGAFFLQSFLARQKIEKSAFEGAIRWLNRDYAIKPSGREVQHSWNVLKELTKNLDVRRYLVEQLSQRDWILPVNVVPSVESKTRFYESELRCHTVDVARMQSNTPLCVRPKNSHPMLMRQIWIPDGFPLRYALLYGDVAAFDAGGTNELKFVTGFAKRRNLQEEGVNGIVALRISPDGMLAVAEAEEPSPALLAFDPFSGDEYWRMPIQAPITAFAFGNSCERLAFATTNESVRILTSRGIRVGQELHLGRRIDALRFEPGDDVLHILANNTDISCAIVVQDHDCDVQIPSDCGSAESARAFMNVVVPNHGISNSDIDILKLSKDVFGSFARYALSPCDNRTVNVFSSIGYDEWSEKLIKQGNILKIIDIKPDDARAAMYQWFSTAEGLARIHAMNRIGCSDYIDAKLLKVHFYDDPQVMWYSDYNFRYTLSQDPECVEAKDLCERIFLRESGRKQLRTPSFFSEPQSENNLALRKFYLSKCKLQQMIFDLDKKKRECDFRHEDVARRFAPTPSDDAVSLWGKMLRNLKCGTDAGALACFDAFVKANDPAELRIAEYAPAVRMFIRERKRLKIEGGVLVMGFESPATEHPSFNVGDIIIQVNGVECRDDRDYDRALKVKVHDRPKLVVLRLNSSATQFDRLSFELAKCPRFGRRSLSEK